MTTHKTGWLPKNEPIADEMADALIDYADRETTYGLGGFALSRDIDLTDINDLVEVGDPEKPFYLPDSCAVAWGLVNIRQNLTDAFCFFYWRDKDGRVKEVLQLMDEATGEWYTKHVGYVS